MNQWCMKILGHLFSNDWLTKAVAIRLLCNFYLLIHGWIQSFIVWFTTSSIWLWSQIDNISEKRITIIFPKLCATAEKWLFDYCVLAQLAHCLSYCYFLLLSLIFVPTMYLQELICGLESKCIAITIVCLSHSVIMYLSSLILHFFTSISRVSPFKVVIWCEYG